MDTIDKKPGLTKNWIRTPYLVGTVQVVVTTRPKKDKNKILYTYQSGFRKHYSTDTCLSYLTDRLRNGFEKGLLYRNDFNRSSKSFRHH